MVLLAGLLMLLGIPFVGTAPAAAADDLLQISKDVDKPLAKPGEVFSYRINVSCSEADCLESQLTDILPDELVGFQIRNASFSPGAVSHTVTWTPGVNLDSPRRRYLGYWVHRGLHAGDRCASRDRPSGR